MMYYKDIDSGVRKKVRYVVYKDINSGVERIMDMYTTHYE